MRSPYSGDSRQVRYVPLFGLVYGYYAIYGGLGVRPALFSKGQNYSVRRTRPTRILCVMSTSMAMSTMSGLYQEHSACAPLSSQREQNYKRSPYSANSYDMRDVFFNGSVHFTGYGGAVSGGFGVRPALLSERNYAFAVLGLFSSCAICWSAWPCYRCQCGLAGWRSRRAPRFLLVGNRITSVRRTQAPRIVCAMYTSTVMSTIVIQCLAASACAPLSSRREQNYKRSPYSSGSSHVRHVYLNGGVSYDNAVSVGYGVRPALLSEKLCVRRSQAIRIICA